MKPVIYSVMLIFGFMILAACGSEQTKDSPEAKATRSAAQTATGIVVTVEGREIGADGSKDSADLASSDTRVARFMQVLPVNWVAQEGSAPRYELHLRADINKFACTYSNHPSIYLSELVVWAKAIDLANNKTLSEKAFKGEDVACPTEGDSFGYNTNTDSSPSYDEYRTWVIESFTGLPNLLEALALQTHYRHPLQVTVPVGDYDQPAIEDMDDTHLVLNMRAWLEIRRIDTGEVVQTIIHPGENMDHVKAVIHPGGELLFTNPSPEGENTIFAWDMQSGELLRTYVLSGGSGVPGARSYPVEGFFFSADGSRMVAYNERETLIWDVETGELLYPIRLEWGPQNLWVHRDRLFIRTKGENEGILYIPMVDLMTGEDLGVIENACGDSVLLETEVRAPSGDYFAIECYQGGNRYVQRIWNFETGEIVLEVPGSRHSDVSVAYNADYSQVAVLEKEKIVLYDLQTGETKGTFVHNRLNRSDDVTSVAFATNDNRLISSSEDGWLWYWDIATGDLLFSDAGGFSAVNALPDSPLTILDHHQVWNLEAGQFVMRLSEVANGKLVSAYYLPESQTVMGIEAVGEHEWALIQIDLLSMVAPFVGS